LYNDTISYQEKNIPVWKYILVEDNMKQLIKKKIAVIGSGNMAGAMIGALLKKNQITPDQITASDPYPQQQEAISKKYGVIVTSNNPEAVDQADIIILSVKPQVLPGVLDEIKGHIPGSSLVFSIVAGMPIARIKKGLSHKAIIRAMPNTPAQISAGMTVWTASNNVTEDQRADARIILEAMGKELYVEDEDSLDMATAVSGTGPTYVFLLAEALVDAAVHLGFSRRNARLIVLETLKGSVDFAQQSDLHLAQLRNMVTSPGGTSAEAIYQLEKGGMRTILSKAVWAAYQKSHLLGKKAEDPPDKPLRVES
jgi:pyrroline-5-carboxylate reductase